MSEFRIMTTPEELEELDLDTLLINDEGMVRDQWSWFGDFTMGIEGIFPLAIIASGAQVRAALKVMEQDNG